MATFEEALAGMRRGEIWECGEVRYRMNGANLEWLSTVGRWAITNVLPNLLLDWRRAPALPLKPKTITLYRPVIKTEVGGYYCDVWTSKKEDGRKVVAWEERTVEVSE